MARWPNWPPSWWPIWSPLCVSTYQLEQVVERTVRELELRKRESGRLGVQEARKLSNPILRPIGRSVGWNARRKSACQRHATTRLANSSVSSTRHRRAAAVTPHCAPLRYADVGLLGYRASGTRSPYSNFFSIKKRTRNIATVFKQ